MFVVIFFLFLQQCTNILRHHIWDHARVHIFNQPISDESTKSFSIKLSTHQDLLSDWSIYSYLYCIWLDGQRWM